MFKQKVNNSLVEPNTFVKEGIGFFIELNKKKGVPMWKKWQI